ncbi:MAG TPA: hypothetical protein VGI39_35855 [Polyangiaceae bacterium]
MKRLSGVLGLALCAVASAGCSKLIEEPKVLPFEVQVTIVSDPGKPLAGAELLAGTKVVGRTGASGTAMLRFTGTEGDQVDLVVRCPADYESPTRTLSIGLRRLAPGSPLPKFEAACPPTSRTTLVGVRADNGANLPVTVLGRVVTKTDASGAALFTLHTKSGEQVVVTLDTTGEELLKPQSPALTFVAKDQDDFVVLETTFTVGKKKLPRVKPRPRPMPLNP